ncbi:YihY/virulence factor BrkB family protein [Ferruginibacter albus]|uniref:YihY/virulence factor BrkB family protein n=1 Tax=Ferruginibacter albus TaxID=2875540 RepID=UPI001CC474DE|nr:YihY/virulence factor BrkB family protein [Ferruginibacter albus]UAY53340.1 YihY/virulence factor BrkB family protein [Ferruginibacter albus]
MKYSIKNLYQFIKQVVSEFSNDNVFKYSASLSYYTIFSLAPMLIIIISVCSFFFGKEAMQGEIYGQIAGLVGKDAALQIQSTIKSTHLSNTTVLATIISVVSLILGATGVFGEIQDSLNKIWGLKVKPKSGIWKVVINRLLSFSLVLSLGFILVVSLVLNAIILSFGSRLDAYLSGLGTSLISLIDIVVSLVVNTILFAAIFKILPDAKIRWKDVTVGALITSVLFIAGKFLIGYYLATSKLTSVYGAAGSIILILLWTYYSSAILYMGAEFTKVYAIKYGNKILPNDYSTWVKTEEVPVAGAK